MTKPSDLIPGQTFPSPREEEGIVIARCAYGACEHGHDRPQSVHVRDTRGSEFFIALPDQDGFHVCDDQGDGLFGQRTCSTSADHTNHRFA